jgi:hypothetical protein
MTAEVFRRMPYAEAEAKAQKVLVDGYGEGLVLQGNAGYYALYYLFGLLGLRAPVPSHPPDWVAGPQSQMAHWLEANGYNLFINESK